MIYKVVSEMKHRNTLLPMVSKLSKLLAPYLLPKLQILCTPTTEMKLLTIAFRAGQEIGPSLVLFSNLKEYRHLSNDYKMSSLDTFIFLLQSVHVHNFGRGEVLVTLTYLTPQEARICFFAAFFDNFIYYHIPTFLILKKTWRNKTTKIVYFSQKTRYWTQYAHLSDHCTSHLSG